MNIYKTNKFKYFVKEIKYPRVYKEEKKIIKSFEFADGFAYK